MGLELVGNDRLAAAIEEARAQLQRLIDTPWAEWTPAMKELERPIEITRTLCADILEGEVIIYEDELPPIRRMYEPERSGNVVYLNAGSRKVWAWVDMEILEFLNVEDAAKHFNISPVRVKLHCNARQGFDEELEISFEWAIK